MDSFTVHLRRRRLSLVGENEENAIWWRKRMNHVKERKCWCQRKGEKSKEKRQKTEAIGEINWILNRCHLSNSKRTQEFTVGILVNKQRHKSSRKQYWLPTIGFSRNFCTFRKKTLIDLHLVLTESFNSYCF